MDDLISRNALFDAMRDEEFQTFVPLDEIDAVIAKAPTIKAVEIPCDIGDVVYYTKPTVYAYDTGKGVKRGRVVGIEVTKNRRKFVWVRFDFQPEGSAMAIEFEKFGTDIFLSEYKAMKALRRRCADRG